MKPQIQSISNYNLANYWAPPCTMVMVMVFFLLVWEPPDHPQWGNFNHRLQIEVFQALTSHPHRSHGLLEPFDEFVVLNDAILVFVGLKKSECFSAEHWWMVTESVGDMLFFSCCVTKSGSFRKHPESVLHTSFTDLLLGSWGLHQRPFSAKVRCLKAASIETF